MKVFRIAIFLIIVLNQGGYSQSTSQSIQEQEAEIKTNLEELVKGFENLQNITDQLNEEKKKGIISLEEINRREAKIETLENKLIRLDNSITKKKENLKKLKTSPQAIAGIKEITEQKNDVEVVAVNHKKDSRYKEENVVVASLTRTNKKLRNHIKIKKESSGLMKKIKLNQRILSIGKLELKNKKEKMKKAMDSGNLSSSISQMAKEIKKSESWLHKIEIENKKLKQRLKNIKS